MAQPRLTLSPARLRLLLHVVQEAKGRTPEESVDLDKLFCTLNAMNGRSPMRPAPKEKPPRPFYGGRTVADRLADMAADRGVRAVRLGAGHFFIRKDNPAAPHDYRASGRRPWPSHAQLDDPSWIENTFDALVAQVLEAR